jgi:hypothetical protein
MVERPEVNGLPLPHLLVQLLAEGRWVHPGDSVIQRAIPFLQGPVDFLGLDGMRSESRWPAAGTPQLSSLAFFSTARGRRSLAAEQLPWLDADKATFIAVNRDPGDDLAIALDYRTSEDDPRVVACEWPEGTRGCVWRAVSDTFSAFAGCLIRPAPGCSALDVTWLTPQVLAVAAGLDENRIPILGDLLEEAGCTQAELVRHLRRPGQHLSGCWALDYILNRA